MYSVKWWSNNKGAAKRNLSGAVTVSFEKARDGIFYATPSVYQSLQIRKVVREAHISELLQLCGILFPRRYLLIAVWRRNGLCFLLPLLSLFLIKLLLLFSQEFLVLLMGQDPPVIELRRVQRFP